MTEEIFVHASGKNYSEAKMKAIKGARDILGVEQVYASMSDMPRCMAWRMTSCVGRVSRLPGWNVDVDATFEYLMGKIA